MHFPRDPRDAFICDREWTGQNETKITIGTTKATHFRQIIWYAASGLTNLYRLDLMQTPITDEGLVHLSGLKNLKILIVHSTLVTDEGKMTLKEALPDVEFEGPE